MRHVVVLIAIVLAAGCADVTEPYELAHPRVIAIRTEPAALAPGARGRIEVLVTGADGPRLAPDDTLAVTVPAALAALVRVAREGDGWSVVAPSAEQVAAARAVLSVPDDQPLALPLELVTEVDGVTLAAQKWTIVGASADNPAIDGVAVDGVAASELRVAAGSSPRLSVRHDAGDAAVVRWLSSVGDLARYQTAEATLDAARAAAGAIVVVVRDGRGGVAWRIVPAAVE